jgi:hypothetical protein
VVLKHEATERVDTKKITPSGAVPGCRARITARFPGLLVTDPKLVGFIR